MSGLFRLPAVFVGAATRVAQAPSHLAPTQPEVAFLGRSNCGKSSLINALLGRKHLVKTAKRPGKTAMLNFFVVGGQLTLTDMPGYGFGSRPEWGPMVTEYLTQRPQLRVTCLLVDGRRGIMPIDETVMDMLDGARVPYLMVLTKVDKVSQDQLQKLLTEIPQTIKSRTAKASWIAPLAAVSAHDKLGLDDLRQILVDHCFPKDAPPAPTPTPPPAGPVISPPAGPAISLVRPSARASLMKPQVYRGQPPRPTQPGQSAIERARPLAKSTIRVLQAPIKYTRAGHR